MSEKAAPYPWKFAAFVAATNAATAIYQGYMSKYFEQSGFSGLRLMALLASAPAVAILAQPAWGRLGDRARQRNSVLKVMILVPVLLAGLYGLSSSFVWLLAVNGLFAAFFTAIQPMGDSIILEDLDRRSLPFGLLRYSGSLSFALVNLGIAWVFEGRYRLIPWVTAAFLLLCYPAALLLPPTRGHQHGRPRVHLKEMFRVPHMKRLLALALALQLALGYFYSYFTLYFTGLPGSGTGLAGLAYFISAASEVFFLLFADRLFKRFGAGRLMLVSAFLLSLRFALLGFTRSVGVALASQLLHAGCFVVITFSMARYISLAVPAELRASGQMVLAVAGFGLARIFGIFGGGLVSGLAGSLSGGFLLMSGLSLAALLLSAPYFLKNPPANGEKRA